VWDLRANFTSYDSSYLALAEALACPLYTSDGKLLAPNLHDADVRHMT
jgi:predicted nucleic acid-binding protein